MTHSQVNAEVGEKDSAYRREHAPKDIKVGKLVAMVERTDEEGIGEASGGPASVGR